MPASLRDLTLLNRTPAITRLDIDFSYSRKSSFLPRGKQLSARHVERQIQGEIGRSLNIAVDFVKVHAAALSRKLGIKNCPARHHALRQVSARTLLIPVRDALAT